MFSFKMQKGSITVVTAILLPVILTFTGIAVDIGRLYVEKAKLQNLADAAATSALVELKKAKYYKPGTGTLTNSIPIGALSHNSEEVELIRDTVNQAAYDYLEKNKHIEALDDSKSKVDTEFYVLRNSDPETQDENYKYYDYRYYYEVILKKDFPIYFARFVHPGDMEVRAGAVCMIDIQEPNEKTKYAAALEAWGKLSMEDLRSTANAQDRLNMDIYALYLIANNIIGKDMNFLKNELGLTANSETNGKLLGHYLEGTDAITGAVSSSYTASTNTTAGDKIMAWLQGNYTTDSTNSYTTTQRYLFSDYAMGLDKNGAFRNDRKDGIKLKYKTSVDERTNTRIVTEVTIAINPADSNNGSEPLCVTGTMDTGTQVTSWDL